METPLQIAGIIGYPLGHSISPALQQAAFDHLGLRVRYERWPTTTQDLAARVQSLRAPRMLGANVTVPHKQDVMGLLDEVNPQARYIGAVNTIVNHGGRLIGHNTDAPGFLRSVTENAGFDPRGKRVLVLGAGGAARAVVSALAQEGVEKLWISNRTAARARELADAVRQLGGVTISTLPWGIVTERLDIIVNTTVLGMKGGPAEGESPLPAAAIQSSALVCDLVYNPADTPFLQAARSVGARTLGGLPMLVYQGAIAFELWTGQRAPTAVMFAAAGKAL